MNKFRFLALAFSAAIAFAACGGTAENKPAANATASNATNSNANTAKPVAAALNKEALYALEKTGWEAWKNRKTDGLEELISDKYVGFSSKDGRVDKAANIKGMATTNCTVNSYSWSDEQMNMVGTDVAVLTFKGDQDYTCDGKKGPTPVWSSSVYVRDGDKWRNQLYVENPVVDPKAAPPPAKKGEVAATETTPDALTEALMSVEKAAWEAWKVRDAKGVEGAMAKEFLNISGTGRRDRAASLKNWSEPKCEGLGYTFLEPKSVQLAPDVALVTYKANATGKCDGVGIAPTMWVASYSIKENGAWKNAFYTDVAR
ncbi:MAG: hypothetical protein DMF62_12380 [Acidobacteria bacterium]|nr:MAG: hypothetical protein DMF62_12380 [Acidobacteriota bacterium]